MKHLVVIGLIAVGASRALADSSAAELFDQGQAAFDRQDYATAIATWQRLYHLSSEPELLFDIAQAYGHLGDCTHALETYRRFITLAPTSKYRHDAERFVRELTSTCTDPSPQTHEAASKVQPHDHVETGTPTLQIAGLASAGAGVVSFAVGVYFGHRASTLGDDVTNACKIGCDWAAFGPKDADGQRDETKQYVFIGIGVAAIAAGGVLYLVGAREQTPIAITPTRDGAAVTWSRAW